MHINTDELVLIAVVLLWLNELLLLLGFLLCALGVDSLEFLFLFDLLCSFLSVLAAIFFLHYLLVAVGLQVKQGWELKMLV